MGSTDELWLELGEPGALMAIRRRARDDASAGNNEWTRADRVLSRCKWSTVCCWHPSHVCGLQIAAFLELHPDANFMADGEVRAGHVGAVRFAYRNHKPVTIRFTRTVTASSDDTVVESHGDKKRLSMLPARANAVPYCEDIVPDLVHLQPRDAGDHVFIDFSFVSPDEFVRGSDHHELALRFPEGATARRCPCC